MPELISLSEQDMNTLGQGFALLQKGMVFLFRPVQQIEILPVMVFILLVV